MAISLGQLLPHAEVIVVTTPQGAAAAVAERSATVARQTGQRVIGVIENMSGLAQPDGTVLELFGSGGGADVAARLSRVSRIVVISKAPTAQVLAGVQDSRKDFMLSMEQLYKGAKVEADLLPKFGAGVSMH